MVKILLRYCVSEGNSYNILTQIFRCQTGISEETIRTNVSVDVGLSLSSSHSCLTFVSSRECKT